MQQTEIKTMISAIFKLNETLKTAKKIYNEKESFSMLQKYQNSTENLQELINQQCKETAVIIKSVFNVLYCTVVSVKSDIDDLSVQFKNLILSLQIKIKNIENILEQIMTVFDSQFTASLYQQYLS